VVVLYVGSGELVLKWANSWPRHCLLIAFQPIKTLTDPQTAVELVPVATTEERRKIPVPFGEEPETFPEITELETKPTSFVEVNGEKIAIPERPKTPDNCCMSGCVHW
jgi:hypothetical protein